MFHLSEQLRVQKARMGMTAIWGSRMDNKKNRRILIIDDNRSIHEDFRKILTARTHVARLDDAAAELFGNSPVIDNRPAYEIDSAYQGEEGYEMVRKQLAIGNRY